MKYDDHTYLMKMFGKFDIPIPGFSEPWEASVLALIKAMEKKNSELEQANTDLHWGR